MSEHELHFLGTVCQCITAVCAILGVLIAVHAVGTDREKKMTQGFLEFFQPYSEKLSELRKEIYADLEATGKDPDDIAKDSDIDRRITKYANLMEDLSVGVNTGVYDINMFMRIEGRAVQKHFNAIKPVIDRWRKESDRPIPIFSDFQLMLEEVGRRYSISDKHPKRAYKWNPLWPPRKKFLGLFYYRGWFKGMF